MRRDLLMRQCREALSLSQTQFAKKLGMSSDAVRRRENGLTDISNEVLGKIKSLLDAKPKPNLKGH